MAASAAGVQRESVQAIKRPCSDCVHVRQLCNHVKPVETSKSIINGSLWPVCTHTPVQRNATKGAIIIRFTDQHRLIRARGACVCVSGQEKSIFHPIVIEVV